MVRSIKSLSGEARTARCKGRIASIYGGVRQRNVKQNYCSRRACCNVLGFRSEHLLTILVPMRDEEFDSFLASSAAVYADDKMRSAVG